MMQCGVMPEEIDPMIKNFMEKDVDKDNKIDLIEFRNIITELITRTLNEKRLTNNREGINLINAENKIDYQVENKM